MEENIKEKNKRSLEQTLTNNYRAILIAMLLGLITSLLVTTYVYGGFDNFGPYMPLPVICPGLATIICGLLALIILYISRGSKIGTILGVLIGPISAFFITWMFIIILAMFVGG